jgi:predicted ATPase
MLLSFRFANHKSFRDEQQLNFTPVYEDGNALPVAGIFGANASGKSSLITALSYVSRLASSSDREVEPGVGLSALRIGRRPFLLDPATATTPSSYVTDLLLDGVRYTYGFMLDDERILEEWLYAYPLNRKRVVFQRKRDAFTWGEESGRSELREVAGIVAPTALFLSAAARFGRPRPDAGSVSDETSEILHRVYSALTCITASRGGARGLSDRSLIAEWLLRTTRSEAIVDLLRFADLGIQDLVVTEPDARLRQDEFGDEAYALRRSPLPRVQFKHRGTRGGTVLDWDDESDGTLQLLRLARSALSVFESSGILLVDEIDASLHPLLTAKLIGMFRSEDINPSGAQLIFTSHDATLLGTLDGDEVLRRDEIWFTEKDAEGASTLYPLAEFKPRKDENRQRRYLNGSYGAIPNLSMRMFEEALAARGSGEGDR